MKGNPHGSDAEENVSLMTSIVNLPNVFPFMLMKFRNPFRRSKAV